MVCDCETLTVICSAGLPSHPLVSSTPKRLA